MRFLIGLLLLVSTSVFSQITSWNYFPPPNAAYDPSIPQFTIGGNIVPTAGSALLQAQNTLTFAPGPLTSVLGAKGGFMKFVKASTLDNLAGSSMLQVCVTNPTITLYNCGSSATCSSPTTMGSVTLTSTGQAFDGSISNSAINAGDYIAWGLSAGICTSIDLMGTAQVHSN